MHEQSNELIDLLTGASPERPLTPEECAGLLAALHELAVSQRRIAQQAMLLASHSEDADALTRTTENSTARAVAHLGNATDAPGAGYDAQAAASARAALIEAVQRGGGLGVIASAALDFALEIAGLRR
jgi:hypothetical protein